jgi:hypothetical protein
MSDDKVVFPTNDPFASASTEPEPASTPSPEPTPVAEEVVTPDAVIAEPSVPEETPPAEPEVTPAPDAAPELAPIPPLSEQEIEKAVRVQQLEAREEAQRKIDEFNTQQQRQKENGHLSWANRCSNDADFASTELDRLGPTAYFRALSLADRIIDNRAAQSREAEHRAQLQSQDQIRKQIQLKHDMDVATERAYNYGKSLGLKEDQIKKVFLAHGNWAHQPDLAMAWKDCRNALYFAAHTQGIPEAAQTVVSAEEIARGKVAQTPSMGGAPRQKVTNPDEEWANKMAAEINGPGGTIFQ